MLEDSIDIIAKLPGIASLIYRNTYKGGDVIEADPKLDWAANLSHMMGRPLTQQAALSGLNFAKHRNIL